MATSKTAKSKSSGKRELIALNGDKRLIKRDTKGRIKESDDLGKSLSGYSDQIEPPFRTN